MALKVPFVVHSVGMTSVPVQVQYEGKAIAAMVDCLEVELASTNPRHGTPTLRFVVEEVAVAEELFKQDAKVVITVEVEGESKPEPTKTDKAA
jgi:hypothetical protein